MLPTPIPDKGAVLTQLSLWWFERLADLVPHHVLSATDVPPEFAGRALRCRRLDMLPVECIARGYLAGLGLKEYEKHGTVSGVALPPGLVEGSRLPEPIFTPTTKAPVGEHDEFLTFADVEGLVGAATADRLRTLTLDVYRRGAELAAANGILVADTKLEFGRDAAGPHRARRRGADARLVAVLARRPVAARAARSSRSTSSSCATGPRASTGTAPRRDRRSRRMSSPSRGPVTRRSTQRSRAFTSV